MLSLRYSLIEAFEMVLRLKVSSLEFEAAESNGAVFGELRGQRGIYAYAELGQEKDYVEKPSDNPNTRYRFFLNCDVFFAKTQAQMDAGEYETDILNIMVVIYD
jgi:hypothetical protein